MADAPQASEIHEAEAYEEELAEHRLPSVGYAASNQMKKIIWGAWIAFVLLYFLL
jgi:hypothetical protein